MKEERLGKALNFSDTFPKTDAMILNFENILKIEHYKEKCKDKSLSNNKRWEVWQ
jgi:hypothetical protein